VPDPPDVLLSDADVLIDYAAGDVGILRLVSEHIGPVHVLEETLATVRQLSKRTCERNAIKVISAEVDVLVDAGSRSGPLSFEDWLCVVTCRKKEWICISNDRALLRECRRAGVRVHRGLGLMTMLVHGGALDEGRALRVAERIHVENPYHINERVLVAFRRSLRAAKP